MALLRVGLFLTALICAAQVPAAPEYQIKAAYLYNFAKFVEWSEGARPKGTLTICVAGQNPFGDALSETLAGRSLRGHSLETRTLDLDGDPRGCQIVFFGPYRLEKLGPALRRVEQAGALSVGETRAFEDREGMIRFIQENGRVGFEVNLDAARRAGLQLSSQLLHVARTVRDDHKSGR